MCSSDCFLAVLAILFPPLPVWVKRGICSADSLINIALCCLGYLPGLLHAWYIITKYPEEVYYVSLEDTETSPHSHNHHHHHNPHGRYRSHIYYYPAPTGSPAPQQPQQSYSTFNQNQNQNSSSNPPCAHHVSSPPPPGNPNHSQHGPNSPMRYGSYQQQTPDTTVAAASGPSSSGDAPEVPPPSYLDVVKGDHKIQTQD